MEEAYVIGIRLALEDGISAGLAAIQGELATLDVAIATTSAHLAQLRAMAGAAAFNHVPNPAEPPVEPAPQSPASLQSSPTHSEQAPPRPEAPIPAISVVLPASQPPAVAEPVGARPAAWARPESSAASPGLLPDGALARPVLPREKPTALPEAVSGVPQISAAPPPVFEAPRKTSNELAQPRSIEPAPPPPVTIHVSQPLAPQPTAQQDVFRPRSDAPQARRAEPPTSDRPTARVEGRSVDRQAAPPAQLAAASQTASAPAAAGYATTAPVQVAPQPSAAAAAPSGGPVFLDGHYVGRWLADHLAREASRPTGATTGFDPRLTPSYPGALQGN